MKKIPWVPGLVALLGGCLVAAPQEPPASTPAKPDLSKEASIIESNRTADHFENDGTGKRDVTVRVRVQSDAGVKQYSVLTFVYSSASERLSVEYVRVRQPDGTVVTTPESSIQDMSSDVTRQAPEYSDLREKHAAVKGLVPGSVLEYRVNGELFAPLIPGQFWLAYDFAKTGIIEDEELQVDVPRDRPLKIKSSFVQPVVKDDGDRRTYTWKSSNLDHKELQPHQLGDFPPPDVQLSTFQSWEELGRWWAGLEKPQMEPTPEIRAKAVELTKDLKTEDKKLRAIYEYVAMQYHYISISFGIGRYKPHAAQEVLNNAYGDCKDKHTLLASLLKAEGIEAWPALIGSSRQLDPDVPSPAQFDHVITAVPRGDALQWMDTTSELAPMGLLVFPIRGKRALLVPDGQLPHLAETPEEASEANTNTYDFSGKLTDEGALEGKVRRTATGDIALVTRLGFRSVSQSQWKDLVQAISYSSGFGGTVSNVEASSPEDPDHPFSYSYDYARKQLPDWENHRTTAHLPAMGLPGVSEEKEKADFPIILGLPITADFTAKIELPKDFTLTIFDDVDMDRAYATYHSHYSFENGVFHAERHFVLKTRQISANERESYRQFQKAVSDDESRYISLDTGGKSEGGTSGSPEFQQAMLDGQAKWKQRDFSGALASIQHALEIDPNSAKAWGASGKLHMLLGQTDEAVKELRKSIALDPKNPFAYEALSTTLIAARRREEAEQVLRDLLAQDPQNARARFALASNLSADRRYLDAAAVYEDGIKLDPANSRYFAALGDAYAKAGESDKALAAYEKAAALDPTPNTWNNVGYAMAVSNLKIPEAEHFARMAVEGIESDTSNITLDKLSDHDFGFMGSLSAYWDTLAWVYFRQGKPEDARKYIQASWMLSQDSVIADHLAQIEEKLGHNQAAIGAYAFAVALGGGTDFKVGARTMQTGANPELPRIRNRLETLLRGKNVQTAIDKKRFDLPQLRLYSFNKSQLPAGTAEFFVLIGPGQRVQGVKFVSGSEQLKPAAKAIEGIHFNQPFPDDAPTRVVRRGILSCVKSAPKCDFVLYPLEDVRSVN
jgi:tetratricopeptide (TPR) repeat protein/transglutaminase-like putative cysteine protease